jgi:glycosyltransferase involved in cell wall biosynthesis
MKIAYLLDSTSLWGGVKVVFSQARSLLERGHSVNIISQDEYPPWVDDFVPYRRHDPLDRDVLREFDWVIATYPTLVVGLSSYPDIFEKTVHLVQGYEGDCPEGKPFMRLIEDCYSLPVPKLTVSRRLAERLGKMFPGNSFYSIGQGIEHEIFFPSGDDVPSFSKPVDRIFLIGLLNISIKEIPVGLNAYNLIRKEYPSVKLVRVTQFDTRAEEEDLVGLIEHYHVNVRPGEVGEIMRSGKGILISPSGPAEGFGLPALEGMATGVPSVLTAIPSYLSFSDPCDYAVFVPHNSSEAMAQAVCHLMKDEKRYARLSRRGREVASLYTFEKVAENLETVLLKLYSR